VLSITNILKSILIKIKSFVQLTSGDALFIEVCWNDHKNMFPNLYKVSCKIFYIPATSADSERAFSDARNLITDKRSAISLNSENIKKIMFLHNNIEN